MRSWLIVMMSASLVSGWGCSSGGGGRTAPDAALPDAAVETAADAPKEAVGTDAVADEVVHEAIVDDGTDAAADPAGETTPDTASDPALEGAVEVTPGSNVTIRLQDLDGKPVTGYKVALDWPDGTRHTGTVGADGKVELPAWVGAPGVYVALAWVDPWVAPNRYLAGRFSPTGTSEITVMAGAPLTAAPEYVTVSGTANLADPKNWLTVTGEPSNGFFQKQGPDWTLDVKKDQAFKLVALEWTTPATVPARSTVQSFLRWKSLDHDAVTGPTTIDIDFSTPDQTFPFAGTIAFPGVAGALLHDASLFYVSAYTLKGAFVGAIETSGPSADGKGFDFSGQYVKPFDEKDVVTYYSFNWQDGVDWLSTSTGAVGYPGTVPDPAEVLTPMTVVKPAPTTFPPSTDPIEWTGDRKGAALTIRATDYDGNLRWWMWIDDGITSVTMPPLPDGIDYQTLLGKGSLVSLKLMLCSPYAAETGLADNCRLYTESRPFAVKR